MPKPGAEGGGFTSRRQEGTLWDDENGNFDCSDGYVTDCQNSSNLIKGKLYFM